MSYTRDCTGCSAKITWNDNKKQYEDQFFPGEKHDHKKYEAAAANTVEASNEKFSNPKNDEGRECTVCKNNGFPNEIIFFNDQKKSTSGKVIPLERPDKVNGEFVTHEHRKVGEQAPAVKPPAEIRAEAEPGNEDNIPHGVPIDQNSLGEIIKAFTSELNQFNAWASYLKPNIETIIGYINAQSFKKANDQT